MVGWFGGTTVATIAADVVVTARGSTRDVAAVAVMVVRLLHLWLLLLLRTTNQVATVEDGGISFVADAFSSTLDIVAVVVVAAIRSSGVAAIGARSAAVSNAVAVLHLVVLVVFGVRGRMFIQFASQGSTLAFVGQAQRV